MFSVTDHRLVDQFRVFDSWSCSQWSTTRRFFFYSDRCVLLVSAHFFFWVFLFWLFFASFGLRTLCLNLGLFVLTNGWYSFCWVGYLSPHVCAYCISIDIDIRPMCFTLIPVLNGDDEIDRYDADVNDHHFHSTY